MLFFSQKVIKQMRTYILRCYACFKTTSLMTKIFCPKCGNKTLKRVAVSLDENGQQVVRCFKEDMPLPLDTFRLFLDTH